MGILSPVIQPTPGFLFVSIADDLHRGAVRPQLIGHDDMWWTKALHCFSEEFQCRFAVTALGDIAFKHLALVIHSSPEIVGFTADFYQHFVQMPFPIRVSTKVLNPFPSDLRGEQRPKAIPPKPHSLMTDFDPALMQKILHIPERQGGTGRTTSPHGG